MLDAFLALAFHPRLVSGFLHAAILLEQRRKIFGFLELHEIAERVFAHGMALQYHVEIDLGQRLVSALQNRLDDLLDFEGCAETAEMVCIRKFLHTFLI